MCNAPSRDSCALIARGGRRARLVRVGCVVFSRGKIAGGVGDVELQRGERTVEVETVAVPPTTDAIGILGLGDSEFCWRNVSSNPYRWTMR